MSLNLLNSSVIDFETSYTDDKKGKCLCYNSDKAGIPVKEFIDTYNINHTQYICLKEHDPNLGKPIVGKYIKTNKTDKSAILFLKEKWVKKNIQLVEPAVEVVKQSSPQIPITKFYPPTNIVDVTNHETVIVSVVEPQLVEVPSGFSEKMIPEPITFYGEGEEIREGLFFLAHDLQKFNPEFFYGLTKSTHIREIVKLKNIPDLDVAYGSMIKNKGWCIRSVNVDQAKLFLSKEWVDTYFWKRTAEQITIMATHDYAPPKIPILDDMIFKDCDDNIMNINIHANFNEDGGLNRRETYFTVASISEGFDLPSLHNTLLNDTCRFDEGKHYKYMFCGGGDLQILENASTVGIENNKKQVKTMFLTWNGLMNVMYSKASGNPNIDSFQEWADTTLFTTKFGSKKDKQIMASGLLGFNMEMLTNIINSHASPISCIYAFIIGTVRELRKRYNIQDNIPDDHLVIKLGRSATLNERKNDHIKTYGSNIKLLIHERINTCHLIDAENDLKKELSSKMLRGIKKTIMTDDNGNVHTCKGHIELFTMEDTKCEIENVKKMYSTIGHRYSGGGLAEVKEDLKVSNKELECVKHYGPKNILRRFKINLRRFKISSRRFKRNK